MKNTFIIAEAGVNHNGSLGLALKLVDSAIEAGVDAIKFQTFKAKNIVSKNAKKADYQSKNLISEDNFQYNMLESLELSEEQHVVISDYCKEKQIQFLSTPFDFESLDFLVHKMDIKIIKVASGEITNYPFLVRIAQKKLPLIISTGMSSIGEVELALGAIAFGLIGSTCKPSQNAFFNAYVSSEGQKLLKEFVSLLHCTSEYPAPFDEVNLKAMETLRQAFGLNIGFSDHTKGISIPIASVALGATIIEKHFTIDKNLNGPDHKASLDPYELKIMVNSIREVEQSIGHGKKIPSQSEFKNIDVVRKVLVAAKDISIGEIFTEENITLKRAGQGLSPIEYWRLLGIQSNNNFLKDDIITYG
jgi:N-acetylneuraminate synthase